MYLGVWHGKMAWALTKFTFKSAIIIVPCVLLFNKLPSETRDNIKSKAWSLVQEAFTPNPS